MKRLVIFCFLLLLASPMWAQAVRTFTWDASSSAATASPANPVKYRLYMCPSGGSTNCTIVDAGTALQADLTLVDGTWQIFATAYWSWLVIDGVPDMTATVESGRSNVLQAQVKVPPGNPANARIKITQIAGSQSGQTIK